MKYENRQIFKSISPKIIIASFPRSGNNWLCNLISHMLTCPDVTKNSILLKNKTGYKIPDFQADVNLLLSIKSLDWSGIGKSHYFEISDNTYIIYIFRDAREVMASYREWYRYKNSDSIIQKGDQAFIRKFLGSLIKNWFKAILFKLKYPNQIVFISYKNLHKKTNKCLNCIAKFLRISTSDDILNKAVDACSFEKMAASSANESNNGVRFIRKGKPDGGRGEFSRLTLIQIFIISLAPYLLLRFFERIQK